MPEAARARSTSPHVEQGVASYYLEMVWAYILGMGGRLGECVRALPAAA